MKRTLNPDKDNTDGNLMKYKDGDTCSFEELNKLFKHKYKIHDEPSVTCDDSYVLRLAKDDSFTCIAAGLSDGSVRLFQINSDQGLYIKSPASTSNICGVRFLDNTPNLLLVGTTNGLIRLLDLRTNNEAIRFENNPTSKLEPRDILSFDRNSNSRLLAVGTELFRENVNLLFYDLRRNDVCFSYVESHQDDLTTLRFHPVNPNILCSGATDGLVNIFDVRKDENDAILTTVNTESTVHKVNWHKNTQGIDIISCITHANGFKTYDVEGDLIGDFDVLKVSESIKRENASNCNIIDCHSMADNSLLLLAGINNGTLLRSCKLQNQQLLPYANFQNNAQIVRESLFETKANILITGGEKGFVTLWTPLDLDAASSYSNSLKMKSKQSHKVTPY